MHRYWGNFARTGDPNDKTGAVYPQEIQTIYDGETLPEWPVINDETDGAVIHLGFNDDNVDESNCEVDGNNPATDPATTPCMVKLDPEFKKDECAFWDELNIYPDNS